MLAKRIIPCLDCDVRSGKVVVLKGKQFSGMRYAGDPVDLAMRYQDADELVILDIGATAKKRETFLRTISEVSAACSIPLCVGGGIRSFSDFEKRIKFGADQCAINTAALENPKLVSKCASEFGSQAVVVAVDSKKTESGFMCFSCAGKVQTRWELGRWLYAVQELGAGEILLTSIDRDGTGMGYDIPMLRFAQKKTSLPIIASGGCSSVSDIADVFLNTRSSGALAASIFHYGKASILQCKRELLRNGIEVRL